MSDRKGSQWRKRAYKQLVERDGAICRECTCGERSIVRKQGSSCGEQWGDDTWERAVFTMVYFTSNLEVDHIVRLRDGGSNELDNLQLLCRDCHKSKSSGERSRHLKQMFREWREAQA